MMKLFVFVAAGVAWLFHNFFSEESKTKRKVSNFGRIPISRFVNGEVAKISGKAVSSGAGVVSPVSGLGGVYYRISVIENYSKSEIVHLKKKSHDFFLIKDDTGYAMIRVRNAEESYSNETDYYSGFNTIPPANPAQFLKDNYIVSKRGFEGNTDLVIREFLLKEGDDIAVIGKGEWMETTALGLNFPVSRVLVMSNEPGGSIYLSNHIRALST